MPAAAGIATCTLLMRAVVMLVPVAISMVSATCTLMHGAACVIMCMAACTLMAVVIMSMAPDLGLPALIIFMHMRIGRGTLVCAAATGSIVMFMERCSGMFVRLSIVIVLGWCCQSANKPCRVDGSTSAYCVGVAHSCFSVPDWTRRRLTTCFLLIE